MKKILISTLVVLLILMNLITFQSLIRERASTNFYLASAFDDCVENTGRVLEDLGNELFNNNRIADSSDRTALILKANSQITVCTNIFLNLRFIDKENLYNADLTSLIDYLYKLSKKEDISKEDIDILREIVAYGAELRNKKVIHKKTGFFYTQYYPDHNIINALEKLDSLVH